MSPELPDSVSGWRERLQAAVSPLDSGVRHLKIGGYRPDDRQVFRPGRTAAVLVPLLDESEPKVVLTRRAEHLLHHAGQVSFPGGAAEMGDTSAVQTALREAHEEIGLPIRQTRAIGFIDRLDTISDYRVLPVVALVKPPVTWVPDAREVSEVFTLPLDYALDLRNYEPKQADRNGIMYEVWYLQWENYTVWGATAAMLRNLAARYDQVGRG